MTLLDLPMVLPLLGRYMQATVSGAVCSLICHQLSVGTSGPWTGKMFPPLHILLINVMRTLVETPPLLKMPTAFWQQALSSMAAPVHALHDDLSSVLASGPLQPIHNCPMAAALASLDTACCSLQQCQSSLDWVVTAQRPNRRRGRQQRLQRWRQNSDLWVTTGVCCLNFKHLQHITSRLIQGGQHLQQ